MEWLNYHHLLYFWLVAREGSVTRASKQLRLAHPTVSGQIHQLEENLGEKLFVRHGRNLALTEIGRVAFRYADQIFTLGQELQDVFKGRAVGRQPLRLVVGVSDTIAKSIVHRILEPAFGLEDRVQIVCREDRSTDAFMTDLAEHVVDVVLSDAPAGPGTAVRTFSHPLGECGTSFFAAPKLARSLQRGFPGSLDGAPLILPGSDSTFRRALNEWFSGREIHPQVVAELDDFALASVFGEGGRGVFAAPDVVAAELGQRYTVKLVGKAPQIRQRFYAISGERKLKHPAVVAICEIARKHIFA
jgi:LysR family transcriptional regulator, transcriptional activator of nhaA